ncbi:hypothetical protein O3M35_005926 [Rhynocoris fuscipes]|uniref:Uncharacterized protein n=1 Tax=Rhynocoris fuscipes TaxID=488301 RepID=A0AAW1DE19_9HEMI
MQQAKIDKYLTHHRTSLTEESPNRRPYLKRSRSSLESLPSHSVKKLNVEVNFNEMSGEELTKILQVMNEKLSALPTRTEFDLFKDEMRSLKTENEFLKNEIKSVKEGERYLHRRLDILENNFRRNNLIIKNLSITAKDNLSEVVQQFLTNVLQIKDSLEIIDVRSLGNRTMENNNIRPTIRADKFFINNIMFSWDESIGLVYKGKVGADKLKEVVGRDLSDYIKGLLVEQPQPRNTSRPHNQASSLLQSTSAANNL